MRDENRITESRHGEFLITTDPARVDVDAWHAFLVGSYWARGIPRDTVARSIANSLCFAVWHEPVGHPARMVGGARVITDRATFAYLADVYVLDGFRSLGLASRLMEAVQSHPELQGLRRFMLMTRDAHGLYARFGFAALADPSRAMERVNPEVYSRAGR